MNEVYKLTALDSDTEPLGEVNIPSGVMIGDLLAFRVREEQPEAFMAELANRIQAAFGGHKVMILGPGVEYLRIARVEPESVETTIARLDRAIANVRRFA